jgi:chorismate--pyruvate lyase
MKIPFLPPAGWLPVAPPSLTSRQKSWLFRPGALTAGLRQLGHMQLRVLAEYAEGASLDEARAMRLTPGKPVWVREIVMSVDGVDCVVARSLTPLAASRAMWQGMRRLRTRPLADMLYHDRTVTRSRFMCLPLKRGIPFFVTARGAADRAADSGTVLARRSVFWRHGQPLLVAEGFLPAFWSVAAGQGRLSSTSSVAARR